MRSCAADLAQESQFVQDQVKSIYAYYLNYWIGEVEPATFSVYRDRNRTNNVILNWNRWFNQRTLVAHPGFFNSLVRILTYYILIPQAKKPG